ncbi:GIY-YIG nuclease family protein [Pedobacter sp. GR22-6]|uniref:GIY-YIG nuclease family protein n=1 Tax=Pedobacter sp. GR22-6 TaxID=3127957 RepID=UPI00307D6CF3
MLYISVTADLHSRIIEHKMKINPKSFSAKYLCNELIYYKQFSSIEEAIDREKQLKNWKRVWKVNLINGFNPSWKDLLNEITE